MKTYIDPINEALRCITSARLLASAIDDVHPNPPPKPPYSAILSGPQGVSLTGDIEIRLKIEQNFRVVREGRGFKVITEAYRYHLCLPTEQEILAFHWHPSLGNWRSHMHIGPAAVDVQSGKARLLSPLQDAHIYCERTAIEDVVEMALDVFHVKPLRVNWQKELEKLKRDFEKKRTWGGRGP